MARWAFSPVLLRIYLVGLEDVRKCVLLFRFVVRCGNRGEYLYLGFCSSQLFAYTGILLFYTTCYVWKYAYNCNVVVQRPLGKNMTSHIFYFVNNRKGK